MGCLSGEGLSFGTTIPVLCGVIHLIVHTQNNGSNFSPVLNQRSVKQRPVWIYYYSSMNERWLGRLTRTCDLGVSLCVGLVPTAH